MIQEYKQQLQEHYLNKDELRILTDIQQEQDRYFKSYESLTIDEGFI